MGETRWVRVPDGGRYVGTAGGRPPIVPIPVNMRQPAVNHVVLAVLREVP